jgi:hypothetical protein
LVSIETYGVILGGAAIRADLGSSSNYSGEIHLLNWGVSIQPFRKPIIEKIVVEKVSSSMAIKGGSVGPNRGD